MNWDVNNTYVMHERFIGQEFIWFDFIQEGKNNCLNK